MKFLPRLFAAVTIICFIAVVQISPVKAGPKLQELTSNPLAEEYIKTELLADGDVDLKDKFVNENERMVSAEFIVSLWKDPTFQEIPFFKIRNATIVGDIKAESILLPFNVEFWSWFLYIFSGYGQRPQYAFGWSLLVIIIGAFVFRSEQDLVILDASPAKPMYNPLLYSFALFLPYIDLGIASKWDPKPGRNFAGIYKHIHRLLGWILMPIALLTFGGIIK